MGSVEWVEGLVRGALGWMRGMFCGMLWLRLWVGVRCALGVLLR